MTSAEVLVDAFGRVAEAVDEALAGLTTEQLAFRIDGEANSIAWLVWHLTRIQDDHIAAVAGTEQVWTAAGWEKRFGLRLDPRDTGYGHSSEDVAAVVGDAELLSGYHHDVLAATGRFLDTVTDGDLSTVVDTRFDPPVTLGVRLVSVIADDLEHVGQAAYARGIIERR
ncbi:MAG TPA: DinB family protein [Acidimicrobiales bacterium]|nr:DinB family protein [Acidimicrobiales bacterium]